MAVTIINGVNTLSAGLSGHSVAEVRAMLAQALNIDPASKAVVGGEDVGESHVLSDGEELEFVKASGTKGSL